MPVIEASLSYSLYVYRLQCVEIHKIGCARLVKYPGEDAGAHMDIMTRIVLTYYIWKEMAFIQKNRRQFFFFDSGATVSPTPCANTANTRYFLKKR